MQVGKMRQQVTWQTFNTSTDGFYQDIPLPINQGTFPAQIQPLTATELIVAKSQQLQVTHKVIMRWVSNGQGRTIQAKDNLLYTRYYPDNTNKQVTLEILSVIDFDELHFELQLLCKEVQ